MPQSSTSRLRLGALPLAYPSLDRDSARRARPALFDELWQEPGTRILPLWQGKTLVRGPRRGEAGVELDLRGVDEVSAALVRVYLGRSRRLGGTVPASTSIVLETLTDAAARELEPDESSWLGLRSVASSLSAYDAGVLVEALAIANWHEVNTHCPRCGTPTVIEQGGWVRRCFVDDTLQFPRTDAAVIVAVTDPDDRLLLGSNAMWEHNRYSVLAGFVEPGESFEAAAVREIGEESGIAVAEPRYVGSQPWPFPASLMVGMTAVVAAGDDPDLLQPDGEEILSLRWFTRQELWQQRENLLLPQGASIARWLIESWYGGVLELEPGAGRAP